MRFWQFILICVVIPVVLSSVITTSLHWLLQH